MFRLLPILALAACAPGTHRTVDLTPEVEAVVDGNNKLAFELDDAFAAESGNQFWSPLSVSAALGMTYAGAAGGTHDEMAALLGVTIDDDAYADAFGGMLSDLDTSAADPYDLHPADRVWTQAGMPLEDAFVERVTNGWDAPVGESDFAADPDHERELINDWVADATRGHLEDVLAPGTITGDTRMVLANAIYFQGKWEEGFKDGDTLPTPFRKLDGATSQVDMMHQFGTEFEYGDFGEYKAIKLPYKGGDVSMVVVLPTADDGLPAIQAGFDADRLQDTLDNLVAIEVADVALPKFEVRTSRLLNGDLAELGAPSMLCDSGASDFSGITSAADLCVSLVQHDAWVKVDEQGTTAAAVTLVVSNDTAFVEATNFVADHPFLFFIHDDLTGSILFMGKVEDPAAE